MSTQATPSGALESFKDYIQLRRDGIPAAEALLDTATQINHFSSVQRADLTNLIKAWEALYGKKYRSVAVRPVFYPATATQR